VEGRDGPGDWEIATIPSEYEEWNRSILKESKCSYTGKELVKVLEKLISGKKIPKKKSPISTGFLFRY